MKSGILACTYGRPDNWLCFSTDEGKTWTGHFCWLYEGSTTSYNSVEEVSPDTSRRLRPSGAGDDGNLTRDVAGLTVKVRRQGR